MDVYAVLDQTVKLLQQRGKMTYRTLKRQCDLDDETLEDLKEELLSSHPVVDDEGRGLIWTGGAHTAPKPASATAPSDEPDVTQEAQPGIRVTQSQATARSFERVEPSGGCLRENPRKDLSRGRAQG